MKAIRIYEHGGVDALKQMEIELCEHLGIPLTGDRIKT